MPEGRFPASAEAEEADGRGRAGVFRWALEAGGGRSEEGRIQVGSHQAEQAARDHGVGKRRPPNAAGPTSCGRRPPNAESAPNPGGF